MPSQPRPKPRLQNQTPTTSARYKNQRDLKNKKIIKIRKKLPKMGTVAQPNLCR